MRLLPGLLFLSFLLGPSALQAQGILVDHNDTDIASLTETAINHAKSNLHIGYGHTSHGSQLTTGMTGLVAFANGGGKGLSLSENIFAWNNGGTGGALDLEEGAGYGSGWLELDAGYWQTWYNETIEYLDDPSHSDVNVILWSWCGQVGDKYVAGTLHTQYLTPMTTLESAYPGVTFVYMTGHVDHWDDTDNKAANQAIRDYCNTNGKVLYDFADIDSHDPDGTYFEFPHDNCDYYESASGAKLGNWATEWRASHTEGVDWYSCSPAHTDALNGNQKAYAAWSLFVQIAARDFSLPVTLQSLTAQATDRGITLTWRTESEVDCAGFHVWRQLADGSNSVCLTGNLIPAQGNQSEAVTYTYEDVTAATGVAYAYRIQEVDAWGKDRFLGPIRAENRYVPQAFALDPAFPNPFNPKTTVRYHVPEAGDIHLAVYDVQGRRVRNLMSGRVEAGMGVTAWDGTDAGGYRVASGVYFLRLQTAEGVKTQKILLAQ